MILDMGLCEVSKKSLLRMYAATINFFNEEVDCVEAIDEHLERLEEFKLGVHTEVFYKYVNYLKELIYNLPQIDCSDILVDGNVIKDEESLYVLLARYYERTLYAKNSFQDFADKEFSSLILN